MSSVRHYERFNRRIGIVCDQILYDTIGSAADFVYIAYGDEWRDSIVGIDCMLVVSTWRGLRNDDWRGLDKEGSLQRQRVYEIIDDCRKRGIPTAFYSKEDPPNYKVFLNIARKCDYVFTSASECVPKYIADCGHDRVHVLGFCVDPARQNPIGCPPCGGASGVLFAGSWMEKYPARCRDLELILDGAMESGRQLEIVDRNSERDDPNRRYGFPEKFNAFVRPAVEHAQLAKMYKEHEWSVNVNSVSDSETMFAGRCYELLACGCPVVSNYSLGMSKVLPEVAIAHAKDDARAIVSGASGPGALQDRRAAGIRAVMRDATCYDRIGALLRHMGFSAPTPARSVLVVVKAVTDRLKAMFEAQSYAHKALLPADEVDEPEYAKYDFVAKWDVGESYSPFYLEDAVCAFKYSDADCVMEGGNNYEYAERCDSFCRAVFWRSSISLSQFRDGEIPAGTRVFCIPGLVPDGRLEAPADRPVALVEIDVAGNGRYLQSIAMPSLRRSRYFPRLRVILENVDKREPMTAAAVNQIVGSLPNVTVGVGGLEMQGLPRICMKAVDAVVMDGFDDALGAAVSSPAQTAVVCDMLLCGRSRRLVRGGFRIDVGASTKKAVCIGKIALARHFNTDESVGEPWCERRVARPPVYRRMYLCYKENGLLYTLRRIFFGRQY